MVLFTDPSPRTEGLQPPRMCYMTVRLMLAYATNLMESGGRGRKMVLWVRRIGVKLRTAYVLLAQESLLDPV